MANPSVYCSSNANHCVCYAQSGCTCNCNYSCPSYSMELPQREQANGIPSIERFNALINAVSNQRLRRGSWESNEQICTCNCNNKPSCTCNCNYCSCNYSGCTCQCNHGCHCNCDHCTSNCYRA